MKRALIALMLTLAAPQAFAQDGAPDAEQPQGQEESEEADAPVEAAPTAEISTADSSNPEPAAPEPSESPVQTTSLDELMAAAAENAAVLDEHEAKMKKAEWQKYRADWAWGPKLRSDTAFAPVPAEADPDSFGSNIDEFLSLDIGPYIRQKFSVAMPITTFGRINTAQELAELGVDAAALERDKAARDVEYQVRRAYYSLQLSTSFSELLGEGSKIIKDKLGEMEEAREFGEADFDTKDFRKLQVFDAEVDARVTQNKQLRGIATAGLRYFTAHEGELAVAKIDEDSDPVELAPLAEYLDRAEKNRPDYKLLNHAVQARELQLKLAKRNALPNVFLAAELGLGWSTENPALTRICRQVSADSECVDTTDLYARPYSNPLNFFTFGIALGMRWDFDYWQQRGKVKEARAQGEEVLAQRRRAVGAIELEIEKLWTDASTALELVKVTDRRVDAARRWRDQFGLTMQTGGGDIKDAVEPLRAYFEARALNLQARYEYLVARAALAQAVGVRSLDPEMNGTPAESSDP